MISGTQKNHCMDYVKPASSYNNYTVVTVNYTVDLWQTLTCGERMDRYEKSELSFYSTMKFLIH